MVALIDLGDMPIEVIRKDIKNLHLSVLPPLGKVRIAAPRHMNLDTIRVFAISKLAWIRAQQGKMQAQVREAPREYLDRESHYVWGRRYLLKRIEKEGPPAIELKHNELVMHLRPGTDEARSRDILDSWYRAQIREVLPALLAKWEPALGVKLRRVFVQRMKTKWGSCKPASATMRLNTDLAKKPRDCIEYIVVHELIHLLEPTHNARFLALMELFLPQWQQLRRQLNDLPVRHEEWDY